MTEHEISILRKDGLIGEQLISSMELEIKETHISYLILLSEYVYKIKKSIKLPFLDFSTLALRKQYCLQELNLNKRTAPDVYLELVEIRYSGDTISIGGRDGDIIDYAIRLKRLNTNKEMDQMLIAGKVNHFHMDQLSSSIAKFHHSALAVHKVWDLHHLQDTYSQILEWSEVSKKILGDAYQKIIVDSCHLSDHFLEININKINERSQNGLVRDVHGDLHSRNIFLESTPVIFDCIEFDDDLRQIDVLNEIAFFMMDLEYHKADELSKYFYKKYLSEMNKLGDPIKDERELLIYYKMYRASIRAKVQLIELEENIKNDKELSKQVDSTKAYLNLLSSYAAEISKKK